MACKVIYLIWTNPKRGLQKKRYLERNVVQLETFCEAVLSTLVMTYLLVRATNRADGSEIIFDFYDRTSTDSVLFFVAFSTSILTSSLGLAKNLKVGPCRILPEQKACLGGLLSPRFLLIFFACGFTLVGKGIALASALVYAYGPCGETNMTAVASFIIATFFLPGLLIGLFASCHRTLLRTFLTHPSVYLLPVFTHFTFSANSNRVCCRKGKDEENNFQEDQVGEKRFIAFSPTATAVNIGVSFAGILAFPFIMFSKRQEWYCGTGYYILLGLPCSVLGVILSLVVTFSNKCSCCSACCKQPFELGALVVSSPNDAYILAPDGELKLEEKEDDIEEEEEMRKEKEEREGGQLSLEEKATDIKEKEEKEGEEDNGEQEEQENENTESFEMK